MAPSPPTIQDKKPARRTASSSSATDYPFPKNVCAREPFMTIIKQAVMSGKPLIDAKTGGELIDAEASNYSLTMPGPRLT